MTLKDFLAENYGMLFELVGILILLAISAHIPKKTKNKTIVVVALLFVELMAFHLERWSQTFEQLSLIRPLLTASLYSIYPLILIVLMQITTTKLPRPHFWLLMIPELVSVPLFFTSQWTHLIFWFKPDNHYTGNSLFSWWPYALFAFYAAVFLIHNLIFLRDSSRTNRVIMVYITLGPLVGVLGYLLLDVDKDYSALFTSAILLYFTYLYIFLARIDPLTSLPNRQSYYQDLEQKANSITGVVSVDMNDLKFLNDNMGHEAGDAALKAVSDVMRDHCGRGGTPYRIGGDEFVIVYTNTKEEDIQLFIEQLRRKMAETDYTCAFGYAMKRPDESVYDAVNESDRKMYENKVELKQARFENLEKD